MSLQKVAYGFIPTSITGCQLWLDGADSSATGGGATVSTWLDKSTVKANATYVTAAPPLVSSAINGLSALSFTGTEKLTGSISITGNTLSIFSVFTLNSSSGLAGRLISLAASGTIDYANNAYTALQRRVSSQVGIYRNGTEISSPITYSSNTLHTAYYDGTNEYVYTNGGTVYTNASSGNFSISAYMIGANLGYSSDNQPWNGYIGEVIVYNIALSAPQRQQVEGYLAQKWGLTSSLPVGHSGLTTTLYRADYTKQNIMRAIPYYTAFSPRSIAGCSLWLDGADPAGTGVVPSQGSQIGSWVDKSGNGRTMTVQGTAANITYTKVNGINAVWFNNPSANNAYMKNTSFPVIQNGSVFMVFVPLAYSAVWNFLWSWNPTASNYLVPGIRIQQDNKSLQFYLTFYGSGNYGTANNGTTYLSYFDWTNTTSMPINWSINGTVPPTSSTVGSMINNTGVSEFDLGNDTGATMPYGGYGNMYLSEMIIYNSVLNSTQRQQVESYLAQKWDLTASLPGGHLQSTQPAGAVTTTAVSKFRIATSPRVFLPTSIDGLQMWMDASDSSAASMTLSGSTVTVWKDKSGLGNNTTAYSGTPTLTSSAINGKSAISMAGGYYTGPLATANTGTQLHAFAVMTIDSSGTGAWPRPLSLGRPGVNDYDSSTTTFAIIRYSGTQAVGIGRAGQYLSVSIPAYSSAFLVQSSHNGSTEYMSVNGNLTVSSASTGQSGNFNITSYGLGVNTNTGDYFVWNGYYGEVMYFNVQLSDANRQKIEGYLAWKWGLQASLPGGHPYASAAP
jgi:hypothetical protein